MTPEDRGTRSARGAVADLHGPCRASHADSPTGRSGKRFRSAGARQSGLEGAWPAFLEPTTATRRRRRCLLVLALCLAAMLIGCGSAALPAPSTSTGPFSRAANRLCAAAGAQVTALPPPTPSTFFDFASRQRKIVDALVAHLKTLRPPAPQRHHFDAFIRITQAQTATAGAMVGALHSRRLPAARALLRRLSVEGPASNKEAAAIGLTECAKNYAPAKSGTALTA